MIELDLGRQPGELGCLMGTIDADPVAPPRCGAETMVEGVALAACV